jgi:hypothetical protein
MIDLLVLTSSAQLLFMLLSYQGGQLYRAFPFNKSSQIRVILHAKQLQTIMDGDAFILQLMIQVSWIQ